MALSLSDMSASPLPFLHLISKLKHLPRTGWLRFIESPESVASHSFRLALLGLLAPPPLDPMRCMLIGLCHDIAESVIGDIPTYAGIPKAEKLKRETFAFRYVSQLIKPANPEFAETLQTAWDDYEHGRTEEGIWMKEMDKFECLVQAYEYEQETHGKQNLDEFQGLRSKITSPRGKELVALLQAERDAHRNKLGQRLPLVFVTDLSTASPLTDAENLMSQHCAQICDDLHLREICMQRIVAEYAAQSKLHSSFVADCLRASVAVPDDLLVSILEQEIEHVGGAGGSWILVCGFPSTLEQLRIFENHVQRDNYMIRICAQSGEDLDLQQPTTTTFGQQGRVLDGYHANIFAGTRANVYQSMVEAIRGFVRHSSMMNRTAP